MGSSSFLFLATILGERLKPTVSMLMGLCFGTPSNETFSLEPGLEDESFLVSFENASAALELLSLKSPDSVFDAYWSRLLSTFESMVVVSSASPLVKACDVALQQMNLHHH